MDQVRVVAVDIGHEGSPRVVLTTITDSKGAFELPLATEDALRLFRSSDEAEARRTRPISSGASRISITAYSGEAVVGRIDLTLTLDGLTAGYDVEIYESQVSGGSVPTSDDFVVYGQVVDQAGIPLFSADVEVVRRQLRSETVLAQARVGADGSYRVRYRPPEGPMHAFAVSVRVLQDDGAGNPVEVGSSERVCPVPSALEVDLEVGEATLATEFERVSVEVSREIASVPIAELTADDIEYVACVTQLQLAHVEAFVRGSQIAATAGVQSVAALYALGRTGIPLSVAAIAALGRDVIRAQLREAAANAIVPPWTENELDSLADDISTLVRSMAVGEEATEQLGSVLAAVGIDSTVRQRFVTGYLDRTGDVATFWSDFEASEGAQAAASAKFSLQTAALTASHLPMIERLQQLRADGAIASARDLAANSRDAWRAIVDGDGSNPGTGVPAGFPGNDASHRAELYAATLARAFEDMFPTEALTRRMAARGRLVAASDYVVAHPTLDFRTDNVSAYVADNPPSDPATQEALVDELRTAQRLFMVAPRFDRDESVDVLMGAGIHSSQQISMLGRAAFTERYAETLGAENALVIFDNAEQVTATVTTMLLRHGNTMNRANPAVQGNKTIGGGSGEGDIPELEQLLGPQDYCSCKDCRSVLSPAAYLVDLLRFIEHRPALAEEGETPQEAFERLLEKRPDIVHILLDCANTNTPMPAIDMVNEILERAVSETTPSSWPQTTRTSAELRAHPEHLDAAAYDVVRDAVYPWRLPFHLPLSEARVYLDHLGVSLWQVLDALADPASASDAIARERLGMSPLLAQIVTGEDAAHTTADYWGSTEGNWVSLVTDVQTFLDRSGLSFADIQAMSRTEYLGSGGALEIDYAEPCQLEGATITGIDETRLDRIHRFQRLQTHCGWSTFDLDTALSTVPAEGANPLSAEFLAGLHAVESIREQFGSLSRLEVLAWFGDLQTRREHDDQRSFYERAFVEPAAEGDESPFAVGAPAVALVDHVPELAAALRLTEPELQALLDRGTPDPTSTLSTLSWLYRWASLARALGLGVDALLVLVDLSGTTPFEVGTTGLDAIGPLRSFVEAATAVADGTMGLGAVDYALRHRVPANGTPPMTDAEIAAALVELIRGLQTVRDEIATASDPARPASEVLADQLLVTLSEADADALVALAHAAPDPVPEPVPDVPEVYASFLSETLWEQLHEAPAEGETVDPNARAASLLAEYLPFLSQIRMEGVVVQKLAEATGLSPAITEVVLRYQPQPAGPEPAPEPRMAALVGSSVVGAIDFTTQAEALGDPRFPERLEEGTNGFVSLAEQFGIVRFLVKVALVNSSFGLTDTELLWLYMRGGSRGLVDLEQLPVEELAAAAPQFPGYVQLARLVTLANEHFGGLEPLVAMFDGPDDEVTSVIADESRWDQSEIDAVVAHLGLAVEDLRTVNGLSRLAQAMVVVGRLGVAASRAIAWSIAASAPTSIDGDASRDIKAAVRAMHSEDQWPQIAEPLRAELREQQRDALVGYLLARDEDADSPEDLFGRFLTDVQVSACARTSRIKHALSSIQTFVQRVVMNLEPGVALTKDAINEWALIKRYRVWEARRKIFLWPENWLEPDLRDDKTELFAAFEGKLLESELTEESTESALVEYLEGLDQMARLHVAGIYHHRVMATETTAAVDDLHVFARTRARPFKYFHRIHRDGAYFTPWKEVPLEIKAEAVVPVVFNRRLMLFWPTVEKKAPQLKKASEGGSMPLAYREVRMSWSELGEKGWGDVKTGDRVINDRGHASSVFSDGSPFALTPARASGDRGFFFHTWPSTPGESLTISPSFQHLVTYRQTKQFHMAGCNSDLVRIGRPAQKSVFVEPINDELGKPEWPVPRPARTKIDQQWFRSFTSYSDEEMYEGGLQVPIPAEAGEVKSLSPRIIKTPFAFTVVASRQGPFLSQSPFFFQDSRRSFFVIPEHHASPSLTADTLGGGTGDDAPPLEGLAGMSYSQLMPGAMLTTEGMAASGEPMAQTALSSFGGITYRLAPFSHPFTCRLIALVKRFGVDGMFSPPDEGLGENIERQVLAVNYSDLYQPGDNVTSGPIVDRFDFEFGDAYATYNWELFFHIPMFVATRLMEDKKFAEAQKWLHRVFDPTEGGNGPVPARFWKTKPFFHHEVTPVEEQLEALQYSGSDPAKKAMRDATRAEIEHWRKNPFRPHAVARLRKDAYQRWVVMKYLDNLIEHADSLFRQDSIETNNEALQLYVLAAQILGDRPLELPHQESQAVSYAQVQGSIDEFANFLAVAENTVPSSTLKGSFYKKQIAIDMVPQKFAMPVPPEPEDGPTAIGDFKAVAQPTNAWAAAMSYVGQQGHLEPAGYSIAPSVFPVIHTAYFVGTGPEETPRLYFCVPPNDKLLRYWDVVADRLFKLRNCLNIEGVFRQLPLFQPPIDPGLLAKAAAAGVDLSSALADLGAPLPHYRFSTTLSFAKELAAEVRGFGSALADALRSKDAEALSELRAREEVHMQTVTRESRSKRIEEARAALGVLAKSKALAQHRIDYYDRLQFKSIKEKIQLEKMQRSKVLNSVAAGVDGVAALMALIPAFKVGINGMGPETTVQTAGQFFFHSLKGGADVLRAISGNLQLTASMTGIEAGYERRQDEWDFQKEQAQKEIERIEQDEITAKMRIELAERELAEHEAQIDSSKRTESFLATRYTNAELYRWMAAELSRTYFQAYQLAYDIAKQAQRSYQYELGSPDSSFIEFGYWDNRRKGLLAGDRLLHDLRRMEAAYLANDRREYELTKRVSLASLDPFALQMLRQDGACEFDVAEEIYDLDHPGHFMRRIKAVSVTIPAVTGPYVNVNARLTLTDSAIRTTSESFSDANQPVTDRQGTSQSIAISSGQNDAGLFEPNLGDPRYLPFEGKGAISHWRLEMPDTYRQFDYQTIEDVILEVRYTAREGGQALANQVIDGVEAPPIPNLQTRLEARGVSAGATGSVRIWSAATHFPEGFDLFTSAGAGEAPTLEFTLGGEHFPYPLQAGATPQVRRVWVMVAGAGLAGTQVIVTRPSDTDDFSLSAVPAGGDLEGLLIGSGDMHLPADVQPALGAWSISLPVDGLDSATVDDLFIAVEYMHA
ncbi:MAG: neuraminidase-like domain-containing protein [Myxococcota bacterium]